ncbi:hypothetical protein ASZ90_015684 [hydrocarbon metagenome]|uniref:Uncharacterized protein n=1 Tax=hydrocarbon metagenome TaxID=938273 RepID=A0A0W8F1E9_9ZZZZ
MAKAIFILNHVRGFHQGYLRLNSLICVSSGVPETETVRLVVHCTRILILGFPGGS